MGAHAHGAILAWEPMHMVPFSIGGVFLVIKSARGVRVKGHKSNATLRWGDLFLMKNCAVSLRAPPRFPGLLQNND